MTIKLNRRQLLQRMAALSVFAALPRTLLAELIGNTPPRSPFDSSSTAEHSMPFDTTPRILLLRSSSPFGNFVPGLASGVFIPV